MPQLLRYTSEKRPFFLKSKLENINSWTQNPNLPESFNAILTVKSFDLGEIRKRYLASRNRNPGKIGSVSRREVSSGGVVNLQIIKGKLTKDEIVKTMKEPRGIAISDNFLAISSENKVYVIGHSETFTIENDWFSFIHSLDINEENSRILISSSGFDCLFEYDLSSKKQIWEWFAWEHFENKAKQEEGATIYLTRNQEEYDSMKRKGLNGKLISPSNNYLPTAMRAAFINSLSYSKSEKEHVLATLFHHGLVLKINKVSNKVEIVLDKLHSPHGGMDRKDGGILATSTAGGEVVIKFDREIIKYSYKDLPFKHEEMIGKEWIQNSIPIREGIVSIDSNRNALIFLDIEKKEYNLIPFNSDWAVQDIVELPESGLNSEWEKELKSLGD